MAALTKEEETEIRAAFKTLDADGTGALTVEEFRNILTNQGDHPLSEEDINDAFEAADSDGSGCVTVAEFIDWMIAGMPSHHAEGRCTISFDAISLPLKPGHVPKKAPSTFLVITGPDGKELAKTPKCKDKALVAKPTWIVPLSITVDYRGQSSALLFKWFEKKSMMGKDKLLGTAEVTIKNIAISVKNGVGSVECPVTSPSVNTPVGTLNMHYSWRKAQSKKTGGAKPGEQEGEVLIEGYLYQRDCSVNVGASGWTKFYYSLTSDGKMKYWWFQDKKMAEGVYDTTDTMVEAFMRLPTEEEAAKLKKSTETCFYLVSTYNDLGPRANLRGDGPSKRVMCFAPLFGKKYPEEWQQEEIKKWTLALSKVVTFGKPPEVKATSWHVGSRMKVEPGFMKGMYHLPVHFEWYGDEAVLRKEVGFPEAEGPDDHLQYIVEYKRKSLFESTEFPDWVPIEAQPTKDPVPDGPTFVAETTLRAGKGYQSRWKIRVKPKPDAQRLPNQITVRVVKARGLAAVNMGLMPWKEAKHSDPLVKMAYGPLREHTTVKSQTLEPAWDETFTFPMWINPLDPPEKQQEKLDEMLAKPIVFTVVDWDAIHNHFLGEGVIVPAELSEEALGKETTVQLTTKNNDGGDKDKPSCGELTVAVSLTYDDACDPSWVCMLTPLRRAPNLMMRLRAFVPLVAAATDLLPMEMWDVRNLDVGDSSAKLAFKNALLGVENMLYFNTWDVLADMNHPPGRFISNALEASMTESALRAAMNKTEDPRVQHKLRSEALATPIMATMTAIKKTGLDLKKILPNPKALFIPSNDEPDLEKLKLFGWDGYNYLGARCEERINMDFTVADYGIRITMPTYEQVRGSIFSKRPIPDTMFSLPIVVEWVQSKKENVARVTFYHAPCKVRPAIPENPALELAHGFHEVKTKLWLSSTSDSEDDASDSSDSTIEDLTVEPSHAVSVEKVTEICCRSKFVKDVHVYRSSEALPCTVALVVPAEDVLQEWLEEKRLSLSIDDLSALNASAQARYAVFDDIWEHVTPEEKLGSPEQPAVQSYDFVRAVRFSDPFEGLQGSAITLANKAVLDALVVECRKERATIEGPWESVDLQAPMVGSAFTGRVKLKCGMHAYKWLVDGFWHFSHDRKITNESGEYPHDGNFSTCNVKLATPFGLGVDVGL